MCSRCLLPETMPGVSFDAAGLCNICQETGDIGQLAAERGRLRASIVAAIDVHRGRQPYEVIVAFSGGKDSSYTLKLLVEEYGLRCLAVTIDNGFLSEGTYSNCKAVCGSLGVDHMLFTPNRRFTTALYRVSALDASLHSPASVRRASSICSSCIAMINTHMLRKAVELGVGVVAGGYLGGQVPRSGGLMHVELSRQQHQRRGWVAQMVDRLGEPARTHFELPSVESKEILVINPMLAVDLEEEDIVSSLVPLGWVMPADTGITSTNCRLNDLGVYLHTRRHHFHPYAMEIADQLRHGTITREKALKKLNTLPQRDGVTWLAERIGLNGDAL